MIGQPVPYGFWDAENERFIDWLDRDGVVHDHIHLLANGLPVLFGYGSQAQQARCREIIEQHFGNYQRFPTFLSPRIEDYTPSEIGVPYDLCAAGRYWCWDAAYWNALGRADVLRSQVRTVSEQARLDNYEMGERYDMNHVYYIDERNWHGAEHYYEYPNVYWWVVIHELLGVRPSLTADLLWQPLPNNPCSFTLETWGVACQCDETGLCIQNVRTDRALTVDVDFSRLCPGKAIRTLRLAPAQTVTLSAHGE